MSHASRKVQNLHYTGNNNHVRKVEQAKRRFNVALTETVSEIRSFSCVSLIKITLRFFDLNRIIEKNE